MDPNYLSSAFSIAAVIGIAFWVWYAMQSYHTYNGNLIVLDSKPSLLSKIFGSTYDKHYATIGVDKGESKTVSGFHETQIVKFSLSAEQYRTFSTAVMVTKDRPLFVVASCRARLWTKLRLSRATVV